MSEQTTTTDDLLPAVLTALSQVTDADPERLTAATHFADLADWTSLTALRLLVNLERRFGVTLDLRDYLTVDDVQTLAGLVAERMSGP